MNKYEMLELLHKNVVPAVGCTEPVCVAIAAADSMCAAGGNVEKIRLEVSPNVYKNGMSVGIAGFDKVGFRVCGCVGSMHRKTGIGSGNHEWYPWEYLCQGDSSCG